MTPIITCSKEDEVQKSCTRSTRSENGQRRSSLDSTQHQRVGLCRRLSRSELSAESGENIRAEDNKRVPCPARKLPSVLAHSIWLGNTSRSSPTQTQRMAFCGACAGGVASEVVRVNAGSTSQAAPLPEASHVSSSTYDTHGTSQAPALPEARYPKRPTPIGVTPIPHFPASTQVR